MGLKAKALSPCSCFKVKVAGIPAEDEERLTRSARSDAECQTLDRCESVLYAIECP